MTNISEKLFSKTNIGNLQLNNRMAVAPMTRVSAQEDGSVGPLMKEYYEGFAKGGFGMIITEGLYTDQLFSQGYFKQPGISTKYQANSWKPIIESVHNHGTAIVAQLMHAGALSQYNSFSQENGAPFAVQPKGQQMTFYYGEGRYKQPKELTKADIKQVINGFVESALLAKSVGFDGIEIHGANGYLLDQFLTDYTNKRPDNYGGELINRLRIYREIAVEIRKAVGTDFIIGVRFSQKKVNDTEYTWPEQERAARQTFELMKQCNVDYIHTTEPQLDAPAFRSSASLSSLAKKYSNLPVIANGGANEPTLVNKVLEDNTADIVSLGRIALANPNWPNKVRQSTSIEEFNFSLLSPIANLENAKR